MPWMTTDDLKFIIACALGALVRVLRNDTATLKRKLVEVLSGLAVAYYFGIGAIAHWEIEPALASSLGFLIGLVGMEISGMLITVIAAYGPVAVRAFVRKFLGINLADEAPPPGDK